MTARSRDDVRRLNGWNPSSVEGNEGPDHDLDSEVRLRVSVRSGSPRDTPGLVMRPDPSDWPTLWVRRGRGSGPGGCRRGRPPGDWWDEALAAQGALAACVVLPGPSSRTVWCPSTRSSTAGWLTASGPDTAAVELRPAPPDARGHLRPPCPRFQPVRPDSDLLDRLASLLGDLGEADPGPIRRLFWEGQTEGDLALELGVSRQAVSNREQKLLRRLRSELMLEGGRLSVGEVRIPVSLAARTQCPRTAS